MVAMQPDLGYILKLDIFCYLIRREVTMVVNNGHFFSEIVVKLLGCFGLKQEILI
jgi:hypothetical protein